MLLGEAPTLLTVALPSEDERITPGGEGVAAAAGGGFGFWAKCGRARTTGRSGEGGCGSGSGWAAAGGSTLRCSGGGGGGRLGDGALATTASVTSSGVAETGANAGGVVTYGTDATGAMDGGVVVTGGVTIGCVRTTKSASVVGLFATITAAGGGAGDAGASTIREAGAIVGGSAAFAGDRGCLRVGEAEDGAQRGETLEEGAPPNGDDASACAAAAIASA